MKKDSKFPRKDFKYFDIHRNEKYILAYNLSFKKYQIGSDLSKFNFGPKNNKFQFFKDEKI